MCVGHAEVHVDRRLSQTFCRQKKHLRGRIVSRCSLLLNARGHGRGSDEAGLARQSRGRSSQPTTQTLVEQKVRHSEAYCIVPK